MDDERLLAASEDELELAIDEEGVELKLEAGRLELGTRNDVETAEELNAVEFGLRLLDDVKDDDDEDFSSEVLGVEDCSRKLVVFTRIEEVETRALELGTRSLDVEIGWLLLVDAAWDLETSAAELLITAAAFLAEITVPGAGCQPVMDEYSVHW